MLPIFPIVFRYLLPVLAASAGTIPAQPSSVSPDSARASVAAFNWVWRFYWEASQTLAVPQVGGPLVGDSIGLHPPPEALIKLARAIHDPIRVNLLHCHEGLARGFQRPGVNIIESGIGNRAICPFWYYPSGTPPNDERLNIDAEMAPVLEGALRDARDSLRATLDSAAVTSPRDNWLAGQRVRFALDGRDTTRALAIATSCAADAWWCTALEAYVRFGRGEVAHADSLFGIAMTTMPASTHCVWNDLTSLLDQAGRIAYSAAPCEKRDSLDAVIWWMARPRLGAHDNARRAEHYARNVALHLLVTDDPPQRWDWRPSFGGLAARELMLRYGWPAYSYWAGHFEDVDHYTIYLGIFDTTTVNAAIFATAEYPIDRVHLIPWWDAIGDPWHSQPTDWMIGMGKAPNGKPDFGWWPREHFASATVRIAQMQNVQEAMLRRENNLLLAVANEPEPDELRRASGESIEGSLVISRSPTRADAFPERAVVGSTLVVQQAVSADDSALVGLEFESPQSRTLARVRFGIAPPAPLAAMKPGEIAVSDPILVSALDDGSVPTSPDAAIPRMLASTTFAANSKVAVYWETYGLAAGDTVDVGVRVTQEPVIPPLTGVQASQTPPRPVAAPAPSPVAIGWHEPDPRRIVTTIPGSHPIQARGVLVDLAGLSPGDYLIEVSIARSGGGASAVSSSRELTIRR